MHLHSWALFSLIAFIATMTPGPAILLGVTHSVCYGLKNAVFTILGNISGLFILSALSVAGLSVLLLGSALLFTAIKVIGAGYLVFLGVRLWRRGLPSPTARSEAVVGKRSRRWLYLNGMAVALSNPKALVFTTALIPQFIDREASLLPQFAILVVTSMCLSFGSIFFYAWMASHDKAVGVFGSRLAARGLGTAFVAFGLLLLGASRTG